MRFVLISFLFWLSPSLANTPIHEFYVSICEVKHNPNLRELEVRIKTFTNDFDDAVKNHSGESPRFDTEEELSDSFQRIEDYIQSRVSISINEKSVELSYWLHQYEDDATWTYLKVEDICDISHLKIRNEILMELFDGQTNILRVEIEGEKKFFNLTKGLPYEEMRF